MKNRLTITVTIALLGALLLGSPASAQKGFGSRASPAGHASSGRSFALGGRTTFQFAHGPRSNLRFRRGGWGYGYGLGWGEVPYPDYDLRDNYGPEMSEPIQPVMFEPPEPAKLIQPILIERQGDQWVKISGYKEAPPPAQSTPLKPEEATHLRAALPGQETTVQPIAKIPPAVLVFRDGHQEEVKSYTIIGTTLYVKTDYWVNGSWTRKIQIANLDVPATLKLNEEHGSEFQLPSNPREVMIRP